MTTAHRPTWTPAIGHEEQGGARFYVASRMQSAKNAPGHTKLKFRQQGQSARDELKQKDLRAELEAKEREHFNKGVDFEEERKKDLELLEAVPDESKAPKALIPKAVDADDEDEGSSSSSDDSDDDEDEEAALLAELERIKKERAEEAKKKAVEEAARIAKEKEKELMTGNPLLNPAVADFSIKRRWDDDVVFKNQARGEPKAQKRFINDTIRNDFHQRFLQRYIR